MRLVIDGEDAQASCVGAVFGVPAERAGLVRLEVPAERQLLEKWCWAAIASALGRYYGTSQASQSALASQVLGKDCTGFASDPSVREAADAVSRLDRALRAVDCYSHWSPGKPLFERVQFEINHGRPLAARIGWHAGAGHYVLVHGYRSEGRKLLVADPLHGAGEYTYADFPAAYLHRGAWTETFWTAPPGTASASRAAHLRFTPMVTFTYE
jgi:hypothetical protein